MALPIKRGGKNGSGGFLNGVSGVINAITFKAGTSGTSPQGNAWTRYSGVVEITPDGAEKSTVQFLDGGFLNDDLAVSADGKSITGKGNYALDGNTELGRFIVSLVEGDGNRVPEDLLGDLRNYDAIAGTRVTFARVQDVEGTIARGARVLKVKTVTDDNRAKCLEAGKRKDKKTGKTYLLDNLLVADVLSLPEVKAAGKKKAAAPKATAAAPASVLPDTDATLKAVLEAEGGAVEASKLSASVVRFAVKAKMDTAARQALVNTLKDEAFLASAVERGVIQRVDDQIVAA